MRRLRAVLLALLAPITLLLAYVVWGKSRRKRVRFNVPQTDLTSLVRSFAAFTWGHVSEGNRVDIVQNSGFFDALLHDVAAARHHVHLETFLWANSQISDRIEAAFTEAARRGIEVRVLVDQRGAKQTDPRVWRRMRDGGVDFRVYHRMRFGEFARYNHRDHRKIAVIDGRIGYTFGHGIADMWGGTPDEPTGWRDTGARFEGPVVNDLQAAFFDNWVKTRGEAIAGDAYFPRLATAGDTPLHVTYARPPETTSGVQRLYYLAIAAARREIVLQNPYFLPDRQALQLFADAVRRGVSISIMLPTSATSDFAIVQHASHYYYGALLAMGVRVYEHTRCGLHQKVMIVDREWSSLGSTNFDPRSFRLNEEITVGIHDRRVAEELYAAFENDIKGSELWTLEGWNARDLRHRVVDRLSALAKRQL